MSSNSKNLNLERLNRLNEKLSNVSIITAFIKFKHLKKIQTTTETIKNSKYEFLTNRTIDLNDRLDEVISQSNSKFNIVKDSVRILLYIKLL